jgi:Ca-activated chloride channel family protein
VPDADRITPPVLAPGERSGHDIGLTVTLDAGLPVRDLVSVAHCVDVAEHGDGRRVVRLLASDSIPNRDFVLRWSVAGAETQFGVLAHRGPAGGFLTLMMQPPLSPTDEQVTPREITFLLDVSGSMSGLPLGIATTLVDRSLDRLRADDRFNVFFFASGNGQLWPQARPRTAANVAEARRFLGELCGGGGTEMLAGVRRALAAEHDPQYLQMFVFATDGYIGNEAEILRVIETERGAARFFAFGIGSSVNRFLIDGIGELGGGDSDVVMPRDPAQAGRAVQRLFDMIDSPVLVDVRIDWNGLPVTDQYPSELPDLFAGQTISVVARYAGPATGTAFVEARLRGRLLRTPVQVVLPETEPANAALAPIWARARIAELSTAMNGASEPGRQDELRRQITDVALQFRLVSQFTAFVAVDESRVVGDGTPLRVVQPVEMPDGVSYEGVFGEQPVGEAFEVPAWGVVLRVSSSGRVGVVAVAPNGPAAAAGVRVGSVVTGVDGTLVHDLQHLEGLVLQGGATVRVNLEPGGERVLPGPARP